MDVLVIDDDEAIRAAYVKALEQAGFATAAVDNGLAAFAVLQRERVRAIVCDLRMPFLEGKRFYDELSADFPEQAARVIFVTGVTDQSAVAYVRRTGQPVLTKPVEVEDLRTAVREMAERSD